MSENTKKANKNFIIPEELLSQSMLLFEDAIEGAELSEEFCSDAELSESKEVENNNSNNNPEIMQKYSDISGFTCDFNYEKHENYYQIVRREINEYLIKKQIFKDGLKNKIKIYKKNFLKKLSKNSFINKSKLKLEKKANRLDKKKYKITCILKTNSSVIKKTEIKLTSQKNFSVNKQKSYKLLFKKNKLKLSVNKLKFVYPKIKINKLKSSNSSDLSIKDKKILNLFLDEKKISINLIKKNKSTISNKIIKDLIISDSKILNISHINRNLCHNKNKLLMPMNMKNNTKKYSNEFAMKL